MGRDSRKTQYLGGSHNLPLCPTFCDCNTVVEKNRAKRVKNNDKLGYDNHGTKNDMFLYVYIHKCSHFVMV